MVDPLLVVAVRRLKPGIKQHREACDRVWSSGADAAVHYFVDVAML